MKSVSCAGLVAAVIFFAGRLTAQIAFEDVSSSAGISGVYSTASVIFNDLDGDQSPDIYMTYNFGVKLYRNNNDGTFDNYSNIAPLSAYNYTSKAADIDNDGDPDIVIAGESGSPNLKIYRNDGNLVFTDITTDAIGSLSNRIFSVAWLDYNNDGYVDLFLATIGGENVKLFRNNKDNTFTDVTNQTGLSSVTANARGIATGDFDNDGFTDIYIPSNNYDCCLLRNNNGIFENVTFSAGLSGVWGSIHNAVFADYDDDGDPDLLIGMQDYPIRLFRNDSGIFTEVTNSSGLNLGSGVLTGAHFADLDNDGDLDLVAQVHVTGQRIAVFSNNGNGTFSDVTATAGLNQTLGETSNTLAFSDYNLDGRPDLFIGENGRACNLYKNITNNNHHWIKIKLGGTVSNSSAIGARIALKTGSGWKYRYIDGGNGYNGQNDLTCHFGLGSATIVDSIIVYWPSGNTSYFANVAADNLVRYFEPVSGVQYFSLIDFPSHYINKVRPTFLWCHTTSTESDTVTYELQLSRQNNFTPVIRSYTTTDTFYTPDQALMCDTVYYWRVIARDNKGNSRTSSLYGYFTCDTTAPAITVGLLFNDFMKDYLSVYIAGKEGLYGLNVLFKLKDASGAVLLDSVNAAPVKVGGSYELYNTTYLLKNAGNLATTVTARDLAGNQRVINRTDAVQTIRKNSALMAVSPDRRWTVYAGDHHFDRDGFLLLNSHEPVLSLLKGNSGESSLVPVGSVLEMTGSSKLLSGKQITITARYSQEDIHALKSAISGFDESNIGLYTERNGQWVYIGGEGSGLQVTVSAATTGKIAAFYQASQDRTPGRFALLQNYPNPFNPTTKISFSLPAATDVRIVVYNTLGQKVRQLVSGSFPAGKFDVNWDGKNETGQIVSSGVYIYKLETQGTTLARKMLFIK